MKSLSKVWTAATLLTLVVMVTVWVTGALPVLGQTPAQVAPEYVIGPGDTLDIAVFGQADLTKTMTVRPDGMIGLPLIGEMQVTGLTPKQLAEKLTVALRTYLKEPLVTVSVSQIRVAEQLVYLVGEVRSPGPQDFRRGWTAMDAIIQAGGVTDRAYLRKAFLIRRASSQTIPLDLERLIRKGDPTANVPLEGGDVIMVPEFQNKVLVLGAVRTIGGYDLKEGARVLDALVAAGGPSERARLNQVAVTRQSGDTRVLVATVDVDKIIKKADQSQNILVQNADVIYIPEKAITWQGFLGYISGINLVRALFGF